jgi:hypothetical protein
MKQNLRLLQVYIERSAAAKSFVYPAAATVKKGGGLTAPVWPGNPWTGAAMAPGKARGMYTYRLGAEGDSYTLVGHLSSGAFTLTGGTPPWLTDERSAATADLQSAQAATAAAQAERAAALAALADAQEALTGAQTGLADARSQVAELGARVIKGYVEQYGMLNNGWPPRWEDVRRHGHLGALFDYWPDNPYPGEPMAPGSEPGCFDYAQRLAGAYELRICRSPSSWVDLSGTIPQQLTNALNAARDERVKVDMYYLQGAIDRYAVANNMVLPATVDKVTLSEWAFDYWPSDPWSAGMDMGPGTGAGSYTYSLGGPNGYTLSGHLSGGTDYTVDGFWAEWLGGFRDNLKDLCVQAHGQVLKEYIDEWKAAHAGTPPTVEQMTKTGAVGALHAWWPVNPWAASPMANSGATGDFQYTPGAGGTYTLTVRQQITDRFTQEYYIPE